MRQACEESQTRAWRGSCWTPSGASWWRRDRPSGGETLDKVICRCERAVAGATRALRVEYEGPVVGHPHMPLARLWARCRPS